MNSSMLFQQRQEFDTKPSPILEDQFDKESRADCCELHATSEPHSSVDTVRQIPP